MRQFSNHNDGSRIIDIESIEKMLCSFLKCCFHYQVMGNMLWSWKRVRTSLSKPSNCEYMWIYSAKELCMFADLIALGSQLKMRMKQLHRYEWMDAKKAGLPSSRKDKKTEDVRETILAYCIDEHLSSIALHWSIKLTCLYSMAILSEIRKW